LRQITRGTGGLYTFSKYGWNKSIPSFGEKSTASLLSTKLCTGDSIQAEGSHVNGFPILFAIKVKASLFSSYLTAIITQVYWLAGGRIRLAYKIKLC
jgi:hypothetical protein